MVGFEPRAPTYSLVIRAPEALAPKKQHRARLSHTLMIKERLVRIELTFSAWQADGLPLHHGRLLLAQPNFQRSRAPSENRTHAAALRKRCHSTRPSVLIYSVGSVGIEPTSAGLRVRCITLSATIPFVLSSKSAWKDSNLRPSSYKDAARTIELYAEQVRPVGFEPTLCGLKVRCATATPQPHEWLWLCVSSD